MCKKRKEVVFKTLSENDENHLRENRAVIHIDTKKLAMNSYTYTQCHITISCEEQIETRNDTL